MTESGQFQGEPPPGPGAGSGPFPNLGDYLGRGFRVYGQRWQDWLVPMLVAGAITVLAICCCLPNFLVAGPLTCGLYACGLCTLRGQPLSANTLWRNWTVAGRSILAHIIIALLTVLPLILLYAVSIGGFVLLTAMLGTMAPPGPPGQPPAQPPPEEVALLLTAFFGGFALMSLGLLAVMVWTFWISIKTMFVMPLIADRNVSFSTAWKMSWHETRNRFWELLLLHVVASLIASVGIYLFYVGLIFTMPIYFTVITAAYEHRFPFPVEVTDETSSSEPPAD